MADVASKKSILEKQTLELRNFESSLNIAKLENSSLKKEIIKLTNEIQFISSNYEQQVQNLKVSNERKDIQIKKLTLILDHAPLESVSAMITNTFDEVTEKKILLLEDLQQEEPEALESVDKAIIVDPAENEEGLRMKKFSNVLWKQGQIHCLRI
jgi:septal ring factor EnvC (AmiA/AmiB activator)